MIQLPYPCRTHLAPQPPFCWQSPTQPLTGLRRRLREVSGGGQIIVPRHRSKSDQPFVILRRLGVEPDGFGGRVMAGELTGCFDLIHSLLTRLKLGKGMKSFGCDGSWT